MKRSIVAFGSVAVLAAMVSVMPAQQQERLREQQAQLRQQQQAPQRGQQQETAGEEQIEEKLAAWLAAGNKMEIELGQLATQKATDPQVRQFAQQMVEEHSQALQQLRQFNSRIEAAAAQQPGQRTGQEQTQQDATQVQRQRQQEQQQQQHQSAGEGHDKLMQIGKKAADRNLELTKSLLEQKEGQSFDMCYMGQQVVAHIGLLSQLEAMQDAGSQEFQQVVANSARATQEHLQHAMQITDRLEGGEERLSRRPQRQPQQQQPQQQQQQPRQQ